jgi:hypothetical protein
MKWTARLQFHTVIQVGTVLVFTVREVQLTLAALDVATHASSTLTVDPYHPYPNDQQVPLPLVSLDQLCIIHHVIHGWELIDPAMMVTADNTTTMADGQRHTLRTCLQGPEHLEWIKAEYASTDC